MTLTLSLGITMSHRSVKDKKTVIFSTDHIRWRAILLTSEDLERFVTISDLLVKR